MNFNWYSVRIIGMSSIRSVRISYEADMNNKIIKEKIVCERKQIIKDYRIMTKCYRDNCALSSSEKTDVQGKTNDDTKDSRVIISQNLQDKTL